MTFDIWIAFVFAASANILAPGPAIVLAIRNGISLGMGKTLFSTLGNITAIGCVGLGVTLGLGAVITAEPNILSALRVLGGGYLLWLAYQNWQRGMISLDHLHQDDQSPASHSVNTEADISSTNNLDSQSTHSAKRKQRSAPYLFRQSLIVGLTNPKMIIFLLALFPLFLNTSAPATPQLLLMTATFMALSFLSLSGFALTAVKLARLITQPIVVEFINKLIAVIFFGFGAVLIYYGFIDSLK